MTKHSCISFLSFFSPQIPVDHDLHVALGKVFPSIPAAIASLSVLLFIQTCEFRLFLSSSPLIPQADRERRAEGGLGRVTPVA